MKKILFVLTLIIPALITSQNKFTNGGGDGLWSNAANWSSGSVPNGAAAQVGLEFGTASGAQTITLDMNATIGQIKTTSGGANDVTYTIQDNGNGNKLTISAGYGQFIQNNKVNSDIEFKCNVDLTAPDNAGEIIRNAQPGWIYFRPGYTVNILKSIVQLSGDASNKLLNLKFEGTTTMANTLEFSPSKNANIYLADGGDFSNFNPKMKVGKATGNAAGAVGNNVVLYVYSEVSVPELLLARTNNIEIGAKGSLTVTGATTFQNSASGRVTINANDTNRGSFKATATTETDVRITYKVPIDQDEWTLISAPVNDKFMDIDDNLSTGSGSQAGKVAIGEFQPKTNNGEFRYKDVNVDNFMTMGRGYAMHAPNANTTIDFVGNLKLDDIERTIDKGTGTLGRWQLVGNPFPSYLNLNDNADAGITKNFISHNGDGGGNEVLDDLYNSIYAWNGSAYEIFDHNNASAHNYIPPGAAFFVYVADGVTDGVSKIKFTENMQVVNKGASFDASKVNDDNTSPFFKIELEDLDKNEMDHTNLYFHRNTTAGVDPGYDSGKYFRGSDSKVYTRLVEDDKGVNLHNQALSSYDLNDVIVPLGIKSNSSSLKLKVKDNNLDHLYNVYLEDRQKNTIVEFDRDIEIDLDKDSDGIGRFYLHFTSGMIPELPTDGDDFRIYKVSNNEIRLMGDPEKVYKAKVFDFSGRLIEVVEFKHRVNIDKLDNQSIKILTIEDKDKKLTKKFQLN